MIKKDGQKKYVMATMPKNNGHHYSLLVTEYCSTTSMTLQHSRLKEMFNTSSHYLLLCNSILSFMIGIFITSYPSRNTIASLPATDTAFFYIHFVPLFILVMLD